jgi:hypothetical protein
MWLQPIIYRGHVAACATATRVFLADDLRRRPPGDAEATLVWFMCCYARDVLTGELPGPYRTEDARRYAQAALIPEELIERAPLDVQHTARGLGIPASELQAAWDCWSRGQRRQEHV